MSRERVQLHFYFAGVPGIIGVQKCYDIVSSFSDAAVAGNGDSLIRLKEILDVLPIGGERFPGSIVGTIVDNNELGGNGGLG
jgi:hypothetical protein